MKITIAVILASLAIVLTAGATSVSAASCKIKVNGVVVQNNNDSPCIKNITNTGNGNVITTNVKAKANTGNNTNSGGTIITGNATAVINITNNINLD
jgi:hypothetical protein